MHIIWFLKWRESATKENMERGRKRKKKRERSYAYVWTYEIIHIYSCVRLSLNTMFLTFIPAITCISTLFLFIVEQY